MSIVSQKSDLKTQLKIAESALLERYPFIGVALGKREKDDQSAGERYTYSPLALGIGPSATLIYP